MKISRVEITRPDVGNDRRHDMIADDYCETCVVLHGVENEVFDTDEELADAIMMVVSEIHTVSEKKCTFCHKTIPDGKGIYLDEGGSDGVFCDNDVCAEAYICKCVEKVAREI